MSASSLSYRIDAEGRIQHVGERWDDFALANDGAHATAARVLGRPLWTFIVDATIQDLYSRLIKIARQGRPSEFRYRCDAPRVRRVFQMRIAAAEGDVTFTSTLESAVVQQRPTLLLAALPRQTDVLVRICSWCHCVAWPGESWVPLEDSVERVQLLESHQVPGLTHGICESCAAGMLRVIRGNT